MQYLLYNQKIKNPKILTAQVPFMFHLLSWHTILQDHVTSHVTTLIDLFLWHAKSQNWLCYIGKFLVIFIIEGYQCDKGQLPAM